MDAEPHINCQWDGAAAATAAEVSEMTNTILEMRGITKTFPGVKALYNVNLDVRGRRDPRPGRRERRRQIDADEGAVRRLSRMAPMTARSSINGQDAHFKGDPRQRTARASSSSTRSWRWCRCCRSPRTSSSATSTPNSASSTGTQTRRARARCSKKVGLNEDPDDADHQYRRRQAAAGRDRQGAVARK